MSNELQKTRSALQLVSYPGMSPSTPAWLASPSRSTLPGWRHWKVECIGAGGKTDPTGSGPNNGRAAPGAGGTESLTEQRTEALRQTKTAIRTGGVIYPTDPITLHLSRQRGSRSR